MGENFPNEKNKDIQNQEAQRVQKKMRCTPRNITVKVSKVKDRGES